MNDWRPSSSSASSEAVFGSAARGDADTLSDRDILIVDDNVSVLRRRSAELKKAGWSVASYTFAKFDALCARGALFVQHIKLESSLMIDRDRQLARRLASFQPRQSYSQELFDNDALAALVGLIPYGPRGTLLAADILYVTVRNFGVLSLAERGIHTYAFGAVVAGLEAEKLVAPGGARALAGLRFLKCLYRSGESGTGIRAHSTLQAALEVLPIEHFPRIMRAVPPEEILLASAPSEPMPVYFQLRELERRFVALQALDLLHPHESEFRTLSRWIENPRAYASLSSRLAPKLRTLMACWVGLTPCATRSG